MLVGIALMVALTNLLDVAYASVLMPVWAREWGGGPAALGVVFGVFGGTAALGAICAATWAAKLPRYKTYLVAFLVCGSPRFFVLAWDNPLWLVLAGGGRERLRVRLHQPGAGRGDLRADPRSTWSAGCRR